MWMTLRRADPNLIAALSHENAVAFGIGFDNGKLIESDDILQSISEWHIIHFLSSGTEWDKSLPAGFMIGGDDWVQIDPSEEPMQIIGAPQVAEAANHLDTLPEQVISERFEAMTTSSSQIYGSPLEPDDRDWVLESLAQIKRFFAIAAEQKMAITKSIG
jgi:hypothetical protein